MAAGVTPGQADVISAAIIQVAMYIGDFVRWPESDTAVESNAESLSAAIMSEDRGQMEAYFDSVVELKTSLALRQGVFTRLTNLEAALNETGGVSPIISQLLTDVTAINTALTAQQTALQAMTVQVAQLLTSNASLTVQVAQLEATVSVLTSDTDLGALVANVATLMSDMAAIKAAIQ